MSTPFAEQLAGLDLSGFSIQAAPVSSSDFPEPDAVVQTLEAVWSDLFALFSGTALEADAEDLGWGFVNLFHRSAGRKSTALDRATDEVRALIAIADGSEVHATELENQVERAQCAECAMHSLEEMREVAAALYLNEFGSSWKPVSSSRFNHGAMFTSALVEGRDFLRARAEAKRRAATPEPVTPYQKAGQMWDERIGSARVQAQSWRLAAFGCLTLACGLSGALVWQSLQSRVTPYVVEVDRLGEARAVTPAEAGYRPTDPQIAWHLGRFIRNVRSVSTDPVLVREQWLAAYDFATRRGAVFLSEYARAADPFARIGERSVSVQVTSVVRASPTSFQVKWLEQTFERGSLASAQHWTALLTVNLRPPADAEVLRRNPLGLYIDAIDWSRELEPASATPRRAPPADVTGSSPGENPPTATPFQLPEGIKP